jgi:hypothetical protein
MVDPLEIISTRESAIQQQLMEWHKLLLSDHGAQALLEAGKDKNKVLKPLFDRLRSLYLDDLPLIKLRELSDVVIHVDGNKIDDGNPQLKTVNWLGKTVRTQFGRLAAAALPGVSQRHITDSKDAQWEITGLVPGSIYMGFALKRLSERVGFEQGDLELSKLIVNAARSISLVPQFINDGGVDKELTEAITDPALRDAAMMAAMQLSPTKTSAFDRIEIFSPGFSRGVLHYRERLALRYALIKPMMRKKVDGVFVGELNQVDLDSSRFELRNIPNLGRLRCVMDFTPAHARRWLGHKVKVTGVYDADGSGRPRLMRVTEISVVEEQMDIQIFE